MVHCSQWNLESRDFEASGNLTVAVKWNLQPAVVAVEASRAQSPMLLF